MKYVHLPYVALHKSVGISLLGVGIQNMAAIQHPALMHTLDGSIHTLDGSLRYFPRALLDLLTAECVWCLLQEWSTDYVWSASRVASGLHWLSELQ
jgi:hypothetical protein